MGRRLRVVDIFSGCGGLSLGFELASGGRRYQTVLAVDMSADALGVLDQNHTRIATRNARVGAVRDLSSFSSPAEIRGFYLERLARQAGQSKLKGALRELPLAELRQGIAGADAAYFAQANRLVREPEFRLAVSRLDRRVRVSTIFRSFLERFHLPSLGAGFREFPVLPWGSPLDGDTGELPKPRPGRPSRRGQSRLRREFELAKDHVRENVEDLDPATAAFLDGETFRRLALVNLDWRTARQVAIDGVFGEASVARHIDRLYEDNRANVLIGAPPCQAFSNAGRSRMKAAVSENRHVHHDEDFGDRRNALFLAYLQFLEALDPDVFVFENVPRFQSEVRLQDDRSVNVEQTLRAELQEIRQLPYEAGPLLVDAHRFGLPQRRQRYLLVGFHHDRHPGALTGFRERFRHEEGAVGLPSRLAFEGLHTANGRPGSPVVHVEHGSTISPEIAIRWPRPNGRPTTPRSRYIDFIRRDPDGKVVAKTSEHWCRPPTEPDERFFAKLAPGQRWSDVENLEAVLRAIDPDHHLLNGKYLSKASDAHKDWLARIDGEELCRTICAHLAKDGYGYIHPYEPRTISVREAARLQSFPDWFSFRGVSMSSAFRMIGNAFPPFVARTLAESIAASIGGRRSKRRAGVGRRPSRSRTGSAT